jgi:hypothetical protein
MDDLKINGVQSFINENIFDFEGDDTNDLEVTYEDLMSIINVLPQDKIPEAAVMLMDLVDDDESMYESIYESMYESIYTDTLDESFDEIFEEELDRVVEDILDDIFEDVMDEAWGTATVAKMKKGMMDRRKRLGKKIKTKMKRLKATVKSRAGELKKKYRKAKISMAKNIAKVNIRKKVTKSLKKFIGKFGRKHRK